MRDRATSSLSAVAEVFPTAPPPAVLVTGPASADAAPRVTRTLLIGTGPRAARLATAFAADPDRLVVGSMDAEQLPHLGTARPDITFLGPLDDLATTIVSRHVDEVFVALPLRSGFDVWHQVGVVCRELGVPAVYDFDLMGDAARAELAVEPSPMLRCHVHPSTRRLVTVAKRLFDVLVAALVLVALSPLLLATAALVKATSRGAVLFRQPRVGRHRRVFGMLKFRTMVVDAEQLRGQVEAMNDATGIMFKIKKDPRLTRIGPFLRRTSIDELPQLLNVLRGEMSLVGPRPLPLWVYEQIEEPSFHRRFSVLPGMTGLWQVHGRPQEYRLMARLDLQYVDTWTLAMDLGILARTPMAVLYRRGAL